MDTSKEIHYAVRTVKALMDGDIALINGRQYIYQDGQLLVRGIEIKDGVETEKWYGGMFSDMSLDYFLRYCSNRTFEDQILDFPIRIPSRDRS